MRQVSTEAIRRAVIGCIERAEYFIDPEIAGAMRCAERSERSPTAKRVLSQLIENYEIAACEHIAICQDTGMCIVFAEIGQEVHITDGYFEDAVNDGVREAYKGLRKSIVSDPLFDRKNTQDNTPAVIHARIVPGDNIRLTVLCKGFGSENMSRIKMLTPSAGEQGVIDFAVETALLAGANPCPPIIMGICIGGDFEQAALYAKKMTAQSLRYEPEDERYRALQEEITLRINALGIGPAGFGGDTTLIKLNIAYLPTHIAGMPCAISVCCHASRHAECIL